MNASGKTKVTHLQIGRYIYVLIVVWTAVIAVSLFWNVIEMRQNTLEVARIHAGVAYDKDIVYRRWNALHGGVYVPATSESPPNPYLTFVDERDITTPSGKKLTLMNPAYMTRQVHELVEDESGVRGHITSLKPIRPENAADVWETEALKAFELGEIEISSVERIDDKEYMRLMRPLITEKDCLMCHAQQGYVEGDIRGGISVSIPMEPLWTVARKWMFTLALGHILLWLIGLGGIVLGTKRLIRSEGEREKAEEELNEYSSELEESNKLKDLFIDIMRHDLLNPAGVARSMAELALEDEDDLDKKEGLQMIFDNNERLIVMIENASKLAKLESGEELEFKVGDLGNIMRRAAKEMTPLADEKKMKIKIRAEGEFPALINPLFYDVFSNFVSNAIKYGPEDSDVVLGIYDDGPNWKISVTDKGEGIPDEDKEAIFDRFKRIHKGAVKGVGLGLAIVKRVVEVHKGSVWVEDNPAGGSIFYVTIPQDSDKS